MRVFKKISQFLGLSLLSGSIGLTAVQAEDIEVFFAPQTNVNGVYPNIMFIIDTSGSMSWGVAGTDQSRLEVVQEVMNQVLSDLTNVNAGLMRFNNGLGGSVIYPVLNIDKEAIPRVFQSIKAGADDVIESVTDGTIVSSSGSIEFNGEGAITGLRFEQLNIPQGAVILSANLVFTADQDSSGASEVTIAAGAVDSSASVTARVNELSLKYNTNSTSAKVSWLIDNWSRGQFYASSDVSPVIQEISHRAGWCGGNDLTLLFKSESGTMRSAYSKEGVDANRTALPNIIAPRLEIKYSSVFPAGSTRCMSNDVVSQISDKTHDFEIWSDGSYEGNSTDLDFYLDANNVQQGVGLVFQNINVPQGARINYAYLSFTANETSSAVTTARIEAVNQDDISDPQNYSALDAAPKTASIDWEISDNWVTGNRYYSSDISRLIGQVVKRSGWRLNNSIALFIRGSSGRHAADSFSGGNAAKLHIGYRGTWEPGVNTVRDDLKTAVASLLPAGGTPISSTLAEAGAYFKGDKIFYGQDRTYGGVYTGSSEFRRVSHPLSYDASGSVFRDPNCSDANLDSVSCRSERILGNPNYISPLGESCQTNHLVFLTDGSGNTHFTDTNDIYNSWGGDTCDSTQWSSGDDCSIKMVAWLHNNDIAPEIAGKQTVTTHMIGFGPAADPALMQQMARAGGGGYYSPSDQAQLTDDVSNIVNSIANVNSSFVKAGVTVNQYNRLSHNDELYFSLFSPQSSSTWPGNIKGYRLASGQIVDANGLPAIDPLKGEFKASAKSYWSSLVDGNEVDKGGAAEQLQANRKVYSNISSYRLSTDPGNRLKQKNNSITTSLFGDVTPKRRDTILYWIQGYDVQDTAFDPSDASSLNDTPIRKNLGDPLHSQPTILQYNKSSGDPLTSRIYVGTNHGYLHSFDVNDGSEAWAFIPKELLPRLDGIISGALGRHSYGLDGSVAIYVVDSNRNGAVDPGEKALLYIGQRRGGNSYFAFDISAPDKPVMLFKIKGGKGAFTQLGQTWSKPSISKMNLAGVNADKLVMIFGGGYDEVQDIEDVASTTDTIGNAVFIVDAYSGNLLWNSTNDTAPHDGVAGPISTMNAIPSQITTFDIDGDGLIDHLYATDTKAQVFRFDVDNTSGVIKGGRIAHLNNGGSVSDNRRFYYAADAALIRQVGDSYISIAIGSGYRAHPLNTKVIDKFFVLKDKGVLTRTYDMDASFSDLQDITSLADGNGNGVSDAVELLNDSSADKKGWYLSFSNSGEKVIESSITYNNAIIFTSYIPPGANTSNVCQAAAGSGRLYALNILNGDPYIDTNHDGKLNENDRYVDLVGSGIAPSPQVLLESSFDGVTPRLCIGSECGFDELLPLSAKGLMGIKWRKNKTP